MDNSLATSYEGRLGDQRSFKLQLEENNAEPCC